MNRLKRAIKKQISYVNPFGDVCILDIPTECDIVILAYNNGYGLQPVRLLLPHQVYVETIETLIKQYNAKEIIAIPASSNAYRTIVGNCCDSKDYAYNFVEWNDNA